MCESPAAMRHQKRSLPLSAPFPCKCSQLRTGAPDLMGPDQQHALLRTPDQWKSLLHADLASGASQNARNASLPEPEKIETMLDRFIESLDLVIEVLDPQGLHADHVPPSVQHVVTTTHTAVQHYLYKATSTSPQCTVDLLSAVDDFLYENDLYGPVWDKNVSSLGGFCQ